MKLLYKQMAVMRGDMYVGSSKDGGCLRPVVCKQRPITDLLNWTPSYYCFCHCNCGMLCMLSFLLSLKEWMTDNCGETLASD